MYHGARFAFISLSFSEDCMSSACAVCRLERTKCEVDHSDSIAHLDARHTYRIGVDRHIHLDKAFESDRAPRQRNRITYFSNQYGRLFCDAVVGVHI